MELVRDNSTPRPVAEPVRGEWRVQWRDRDTVKQERWFATQAEAEEFIATL